MNKSDESCGFTAREGMLMYLWVHIRNSQLKREIFASLSKKAQLNAVTYKKQYLLGLMN